MIKNYLYTIGKRLPAPARDEILKDIEVNLYDYLEENYGKKEYTDVEVEQAIRSMGHPHKVAEAYLNEPRGLIGPAYLDSFWLVNKISLIGISIGLTIANIVNIGAFSNGIELFLKIASDIFQTSLSAFGLITIVFAVLQHFTPIVSVESEEDWSLSILDKATEPQQRVKPFDVILETVFICLGLVFINQIPSFVTSSENTLLIFNTAVLEPYLPWFNLFLVVSLGINVYLLIVYRWQPVTRYVTILMDLAGIALFTIFAFDPNVWSLQSLAGYIGSSLPAIEKALQMSLRITLAIIVIVTGIDIIGHFKALMKKR